MVYFEIAFIECESLLDTNMIRDRTKIHSRDKRASARRKTATETGALLRALSLPWPAPLRTRSRKAACWTHDLGAMHGRSAENSKWKNNGARVINGSFLLHVLSLSIPFSDLHLPIDCTYLAVRRPVSVSATWIWIWHSPDNAGQDAGMHSNNVLLHWKEISGWPFKLISH